MTAMGGKKQNRALGYATSTVKGDELARTNTLSPANALQGKVAGVRISTGGSAGITTAPSVTIRGNKSLSKNNSPIYVIDGIVMQYDQQAADNYHTISSGTQYGNQLKNLNPDDYESVTVLKGAAATSLYGSRGANGAIVITTKQGKARKGIGVEVNYSHEWGTIYENSLPLQNEYGMGRYNNGYEGDMIPGVGSTATSYTAGSWGPSFASMQGQQMYQYYKSYPAGGIDNPMENYVAYPDAWKTMFQNSNYDNVSVALTGGSEKATFRLSYGYTNGDGNMPNNGFNRHSINFTANGKINDVFSTNINVQYSNSNTLNANSYVNYAMITNYYTNRNTDLAWYKNHYIDPETHSIIGGVTSTNFNPFNSLLQNIYENNTNRNEQTIITQLGLNAQFTDWLDASVSLTYNNWQIFTETKNAGYVKEGKYAISGSTSSSYDGTAQIHANKRFVNDNLGLDVRVFSQIYGNAVGASYEKSTKGGLIVPGEFTFANSKQPITTDELKVSKSNRNNMTVGLGGAVNLDWKDQVFLEVTARNDWLSSLLYPTWIWQGQDNYSVFYPSVNASWVFSDTFHIDPNILSFGKLRASWAQVGMGTSAYQTAEGAGGFDIGTMYGPTNNALTYASFNNSTLPNYDLKPEIQTSIEFGADLRFLNGRIGVDVAYYKTNTRNQILELDAVDESGVTKQLINAGNIQNQGWEIQLDFTPIRTRTVTWNIGANWSRNRGKIKELANDIDYYTITGYAWDGSMTPGIYAFEGGAYGVICSGNNYGIPSVTPAIARFNNADDPNDYRNGMKLIQVSGAQGESKVPGTQFPTNMKYDYVSAEVVPGYYGDEASYWGGQKNTTTILGNVEPDFDFGFNTNVMVNLPNNNGSIDFYAQIDGRSGGDMVCGNKYYFDANGNAEYTLYGRDEKHGGVARVNYKGETVMNGIIPEDVVFYDGSKVTSMATGTEVDLSGKTFRQAVEEGHIQPVLSSTWQSVAAGYADQQVVKQSYVALRELTLGYNFPEKWLKHVGLQSARLAFTARNVCFIYNGTGIGINPDGNLSNNSLTPYNYATTPFMRNFSFSLNLKF
ncbi:SusC/RagA family TonB-linked outer membrane protein [Rikenella microfusus]|uniref:SusC/RagA family TonB-linked outer membrane protein n=1 Tax=Rikenella microfusus TaxID=28139 RepID=UPI00248E91BB|nr:SusC/RagA family TonB-linked outer membrane protein [Rikenella microfusus]